MINSMTGFGRGYVLVNGRSVTVELKSVNHKYLDFNIRLPRALSYLEASLRNAVSSQVSRGHIDISVSYLNARQDARHIDIDHSLLAEYVTAGLTISAAHGVKNDLTVSSLLKLPDVTTITETDDDMDEVKRITLEALSLALNDLVSMRAREGSKIGSDLKIKLNKIDTLYKHLSNRAPEVVKQYSDKLYERIHALLNEIDVDRARLSTEIALFADRVGIDEELVRIRSHITEFNAMIDTDVPTGRSMDFLTQELNREFNTIGSKASDSILAQLVIASKAEVEKLREQVQNIE